MTDQTKAERILAALGGPSNILEIEPCVTRLRSRLRDTGIVDAAALRRNGCHGVVIQGDSAQVVTGPDADILCSELADLLA
jgi:PTS system N-acetylglucosamine-specific IIB component